MGIKSMAGWIGVIVGLSCFVATAELPPEPHEKYAAGELAERTVELEGKIVRVTFNRIFCMQKVRAGLYVGELRSRSKPEKSGNMSCFSDQPGIIVQFPIEGFGLLSKFIPEVGAVENDEAALGKEDFREIYVQIGTTETVALGDQYNAGEYGWSEKTGIPDLTDAKKVSVAELYLFPDQVKGKTLQLEFCYADELETESQECTVRVFSALNQDGFSLFGLRHDSYAGGHLPVTVKFPPEGVTFFEEVASLDNQDKSNFKAQTVYAAIDVSPYGKISVKALGRCQQGKGADATYKW